MISRFPETDKLFFREDILTWQSKYIFSGKVSSIAFSNYISSNDKQTGFI